MRRCLAAAAIVFALVPSAYLAWHARDMPHLGYFHDDGLYFVSAKSLAGGEGYRIASLPGAPYQTKYPPLYPLLLSAAWRLNPVFPSNLTPAAAIAWAMVPLYVIAARVALAGLGIGSRLAWILCALIAINPFVALFGISLLSELPFSILLVASFALTERARRGPPWVAALAGAVAALAYLTRSAGIVLLASGPAVLLLNRGWRKAALYTAAMAPAVAGWMLWSHAHRAAEADATLLYYTDYLGFYLRDVQSLPLMVWKNFDTLVSSIGGMLLFDLGESFAAKSVARVLAAGALVGAFRLTRRTGLTAYSAFAAGYLALVLVWNYMPDHRFLLPVFPLLAAGFACELLAVVHALAAAWRRRRPLERTAATATAAALAALTVLAVWRNVTAYTVALPGFVEQHRSMLGARTHAYCWIAAHASTGARFMADNDPALFLYTGRRALRLVVPPAIFYAGRTREPGRLYASLSAYARAQRLGYAIVTTADLMGDLPAADRAAAQRAFSTEPRMHLLYESPAASVYAIDQ